MLYQLSYRGIIELSAPEASAGLREKTWWLLPELNWGHVDFQSTALPTELKSHGEIGANTLIQQCQLGHPGGASQIARPFAHPLKRVFQPDEAILSSGPR